MQEEKNFTIINLGEAESKGIVFRGVNNQFWTFDYYQKGGMIPFLFEKITKDEEKESMVAFWTFTEAKRYFEETGLYPE